MNKKIKIFFILSIFLNVLLLGIVFGGIVGETSKYKKRHDFSITAIKGVSKESERIVLQAIQPLREENKRIRQDIKQERKMLIEILSASDFDKKSYQEQSQKIQNLHRKMMDNHARIISEIVLLLDENERKIFIEGLNKRFRGRF